MRQIANGTHIKTDKNPLAHGVLGSYLLTTRFNQISETKTENLIKYVSSKSENVYSHLLNKLVKRMRRLCPIDLAATVNF